MHQWNQDVAGTSSRCTAGRAALQIVLYILHGTACGFYWEALQSGFDPDILSGADAAFFASLSMGDQ